MHSVIDLHSHSTASDGSLNPAELVAEAHRQGVRVLALTDHDTTAGIAEARAAAKRYDVALIPGIELSAGALGRTMHVVGLNLDENHEGLQAGVRRLTRIRRDRAEEIGNRLQRLGMSDTYAEARELAGEAEVTRTHFARVLLARGAASSMNEVFKRYLGQNRPGYVKAEWPSLEEVAGWIRAAGGEAVLAHPRSYGWTGAWTRRVLDEFKACGGNGIEVVCGNSSRDDIIVSGGFARRFELKASVGSDFHTPDTPWIRLGKLAALPADLTPVWSGWKVMETAC